MDSKGEELPSPTKAKADLEETKGEEDDDSFPAVSLSRSKTAPTGLPRIAAKRKRAEIFVRIRPLASEGTHSESKIPTDKFIVGWDKTQITMNWMTKVEKFKYPDLVIGPEVGQEDTFDEIMPEMMDKFLAGYNCTFLAYGQTGTGKTHTMFGAPGSLKTFPASGDIHPDWGIFPRALVTMIKRMNSQKVVPFLFKAAIIELYLGMIFDLLNDKASIPYILGIKESLVGYKEVKLLAPEDVKLIINTAMNHRVTSGTKCNENSSRSHCLAFITLLTYEESKVLERTFIFGDLSGSERVSKTEQPLWVNRDAYQMYTPGLQGVMTNWDLYQLATQLELITESLKKHGQGRTLAKHDSRLPQILTKSLDGDALTSVIVCLSQSHSNGGESWFSLKYGAKFAQLVTKVNPQKGRALRPLYQEIDAQIKENERALKQLQSTSTGKTYKYMEVRKIRLRQLKERKELLKFFEARITHM